jgi:hypothetical protein
MAVLTFEKFWGRVLSFDADGGQAAAVRLRQGGTTVATWRRDPGLGDLEWPTSDKEALYATQEQTLQVCETMPPRRFSLVLEALDGVGAIKLTSKQDFTGNASHDDATTEARATDRLSGHADIIAATTQRALDVSLRMLTRAEESNAKQFEQIMKLTEALLRSQMSMVEVLSTESKARIDAQNALLERVDSSDGSGAEQFWLAMPEPVKDGLAVLVTQLPELLKHFSPGKALAKVP